MAAMACALAVLASSQAAWAASAGSIDTSFGTAGYSTVTLGTWAGAAAVAVQGDGKIVTAGQAEVNGENEIVATRMTPSGALDPSFGSAGIVTVRINGGAGVDSGAGLALQADGKIVIAGSGRNGTYGPLTFVAVRLTTSGSLDQSFGHGGVSNVAIGSTSIANAVVIQPDGKIVLAGTALEAHNEFAAARLNPDGSLDHGFGTSGTTTFPNYTGGAWGLGLQRDGKLVLAGQTDYPSSQVSGAQQFMAVRLNGNGSTDTSFGGGGVVTVPIGGTALGYGVAVQTDGKLVLAGPAFTTTGVNAAVRLTSSGALDPTYGSGGIATVPDWNGANGIILDSAGRVLLPSVGASVLRLNTNGSADTSFGTAGNVMAKLGTNDAANGAALQADGKIVLAGGATINGRIVIAVVRINAQARAPTPTPTPSPKPAASPPKSTTKSTTTQARTGTTVVRTAVGKATRCTMRSVRSARKTHGQIRRKHRSHHRKLLTRGVAHAVARCQ
ncbi:MAG: hypothetical protein ACJ76X_12835 [Solirubrobacteraceae bacterium]